MFQCLKRPIPINQTFLYELSHLVLERHGRNKFDEKSSRHHSIKLLLPQHNLIQGHSQSSISPIGQPLTRIFSWFLSDVAADPFAPWPATALREVLAKTTPLRGLFPASLLDPRFAPTVSSSSSSFSSSSFSGSSMLSAVWSASWAPEVAVEWNEAQSTCGFSTCDFFLPLSARPFSRSRSRSSSWRTFQSSLPILPT